MSSTLVISSPSHSNDPPGFKEWQRELGKWLQAWEHEVLEARSAAALYQTRLTHLVYDPEEPDDPPFLGNSPALVARIESLLVNAAEQSLTISFYRTPKLAGWYRALVRFSKVTGAASQFFTETHMEDGKEVVLDTAWFYSDLVGARNVWRRQLMERLSSEPQLDKSCICSVLGCIDALTHGPDDSDTAEYDAFRLAWISKPRTSDEMHMILHRRPCVCP